MEHDLNSKCLRNLTLKVKRGKRQKYTTDIQPVGGITSAISSPQEPEGSVVREEVTDALVPTENVLTL